MGTESFVDTAIPVGRGKGRATCPHCLNEVDVIKDMKSLGMWIILEHFN